jgi:DNA gyrase subunit A
MAVVTDKNEGDLLVVTAKGIGKRTPLAEYATRSRYGSGVRTIAKAFKLTGPVVAVRTVKGDEDITIVSSDGKMIRTQVKHIPRLSRVTRGARIMNLREGDTVASIALLEDEAPQVGPENEEQAQAGLHENGTAEKTAQLVDPD